MKHFLKLFVLGGCFFSSLSWAFSLQVHVVGKQVRWDNAITHSHGLVPSFWQPTHNLTPTTNWQPGSFASTPPSTIVVNSGAESASLPINFKGFEYHTGSSNPTVSNVAGSCIGSFSSPIALIVGNNCLGAYQLSTLDSVTPFAFIRPIFEVDDKQITDAFEGKPSGNYRGSTSITQFYQFNFGGITTKREISHTVFFDFNYEAASLNTVTITGNGVITPDYNLRADRVWGKTDYDVTAEGWFTNGLKLSLNPGRSKKYAMNGPNNSLLPYSILCTGCNDNLIVEKGDEIISTTLIPGSDTNSITFKIHTEYDEQHSSLEIGDYSDQYILIFEPNI